MSFVDAKETRKRNGGDTLRMSSPWSGPKCSGRSSKIKQDGPKKLRIIVDLRRSGVTARTLTPQRPVLPRIGDAVESLLELMKDLE